MLRRHQHGFTLTEVAVVFFIISLLLGGAIMTLQAQIEQRNFEEAQRRLNAAAEAVLSFALVNRRLPCPARFADAANHSSGRESFCTNDTAATCGGTPADHTTTVRTPGNCSTFYNGFLPAASIGVAPVDSLSFAVDPWGNRIRYVVARDHTGCTTPPSIPANTRMFTSQGNLKTWGVGCRPGDLEVCTSSACALRAVSQNTALFVVYSTGKNGALAANPLVRPNENENLDGDAVFVMRTPDPASAAGGEFDDLVVVVPVGQVYSRLISAGLLP